MKRNAALLGCLLVLFAATVTPVQSQDDEALRVEIERHAIEPCMRAKIPMDTPPDQMESLLDLMKAVSSDMIDNAVAAILPIVSNMEDPKQRKTAYNLWLSQCIKAGN